MKKLDEPIVPKRITLTPTLVQLLQEEANMSTNGRISELLRNILTKRYKLNKKV